MKEVEVNIQRVREFWDARPCNLRHSPEAVGTRAYFDQVEARKYFVEPHIIPFANFHSWKNKKVLEIGCGIGTDAVNFARAGAFYTGVELSKESLQIAENRFKVFGLSGSFFEGDAENLDDSISLDQYDLIYSFGVLHHTPDIRRALKQIYKFCGAHTQLKIMVYAANSWKQLMINAGLDQPEAQFGCPIANSYTRMEIESILQSSGFKLEHVSQDHIFPYEVESYRSYNYVKLPWFDKMPAEVMKVLESNFGWHLLIDASVAQ